MKRVLTSREPFARLIYYKNHTPNLRLNSVATRMYLSEACPSAGVEWRDDEKMLILTKFGSDRRISYHNGWASLGIGEFIKEFNIPRRRDRLPIFDYIDNEIWIDFEEQPYVPAYDEFVLKSGKTCKVSPRIRGNGNNYRMYTNPELLDLIRTVAHIETDGNMSRFMEKAICYYINEYHHERWVEWCKIISENRGFLIREEL